MTIWWNSDTTGNPTYTQDTRIRYTPRLDITNAGTNATRDCLQRSPVAGNEIRNMLRELELIRKAR